MLQHDTYLLRQLPGGVEPPIEVCDEAGRQVAYIHFPARPVRGCLTIVVCVITFFTFPVVAVWMLNVGCEWIGFISPMDIDRQPSAVVPVITLILLVAVGFLVTMFVGSLVHPRRRIDIYTDSSRRVPLLHVVEVRKSKYNLSTLTVTDTGQVVLGWFRHDRRNSQIDILDHHDRRLGTYCAKPNSLPAEWTGEGILALLAGVIIGLLFSVFVILTPKRQKRYTESPLWRFDERTSEPGEQIGTVIFDPQKDFPYQIDLTADPDRSLDRRFVVALAALLEW